MGKLTKSQPGGKRKLNNDKSILAFFWIAYITYMFTYFGRINFPACISDMSANGGFAKADLGIIAAALFLSYGIGQLVSGVLGDRLPPVWLVFAGIEISACLNLLFAFQSSAPPMAAIWFFNGFAQSLTWSPIIRLSADRLTGSQCTKTCVNLYTTGPVSMIIGYALCAFLVRRFSWRACFIAAFIVMSAVAFLWLIGMKRLERQADRYGAAEAPVDVPKHENAGFQSKIAPLLFSSGLLFVIGSTLLGGMLKDGITTWMPTFLTETFRVSASASIVLTSVLPVFSLTGVYMAKYLNQRFIKNEMKTAAVLFAFTIPFVFCIAYYGKISIYYSVILLAAITSVMVGANALFVSLIPLYFKNIGKVSTITGLLNSSAHLGSALSSFLFGVIAGYFGWGGNYIAWAVCGCIGLIMCLLGIKPWRRFLY